MNVLLLNEALDFKGYTVNHCGVIMNEDEFQMQSKDKRVKIIIRYAKRRESLYSTGISINCNVPNGLCGAGSAVTTNCKSLTFDEAIKEEFRYVVRYLQEPLLQKYIPEFDKQITTFINEHQKNIQKTRR